jgi:hypothetical protein
MSCTAQQEATVWNKYSAQEFTCSVLQYHLVYMSRILQDMQCRRLHSLILQRRHSCRWMHSTQSLCSRVYILQHNLMYWSRIRQDMQCNRLYSLILQHRHSQCPISHHEPLWPNQRKSDPLIPYEKTARTQMTLLSLFLKCRAHAFSIQW